MPVSEDVISHGRALVAALRAFDILYKNAGWFERVLIRSLRGTYRKRLRILLVVLPTEVSEDILGNQLED